MQPTLAGNTQGGEGEEGPITLKEGERGRPHHHQGRYEMSEYEYVRPTLAQSTSSPAWGQAGCTTLWSISDRHGQEEIQGV